MSNFDEVKVDSFSLGLVSNVSAADSDKTSFRQFKNFQAIVPGVGSALPGSGVAQLRVEGTLTNIPALPSGFTLEGDPFIFQTVTPGTGSDVIIIFGSKSSRDRFYVWPDITTAGAWSTNTGSKVSNTSINWLELTEAEATTITTVNNPGTGTNLTISGLSNNTSSSYYIRWYIWNQTRSYFDYVLTHTNTTITTKFGNAATADGDTIILMRFPIFKKASTVTPYYLIDTLPSFVRHGENVTIHTGTHDINSGPDLWLGYIGQGTTAQGYFDDNDLDYNGWHFDHAHPFPLIPSDILPGTVTGASSSTDPIPYSGSGTDIYSLFYTALYDGINESRIFYDKDNPLSVTGSEGEITASDQHFTPKVQINLRTDLTRQSDYASGTSVPTLWSRRIKKIRIYMAQAELLVVAGAFVRPTASYFFIKEIDIDATAWSLVSGQFELDTTIKGTDWVVAQSFPSVTVNGYEGTKVGANGKFEVQVASRSFLAPIYDDTKKLFRCLFTPLRFSGETAPNIFPASLRIDVLHSGIIEILAIAEQNGKLVILGRDKLVIGTVTGVNAGGLEESFHKTGCIAARTVKNLENLLFFSSQEKMFEIFDGNRLAEESPAERIQDIWNGLTVAEKEAAFAGVHRDRREYWIAFSDSGVQRIFAYSLKYGIIFEYDSDSTYIGFAEGVDGQLYGATSSTIVELVAGTPTESLAITLESQVFNHDPAQYRRLRMAYLSPSTISIVVIDDDEISALREKETHLFLSQSGITEVDKNISLDTARAAWKLTRSASTDTTLQIDAITLAKRAKLNR
jgi:hypothetical protein